MNDTFTPIALCADDYAQNPGIDAGILDLLEKKRLSAVSCFSLAPRWQESAVALRPHREQADIGLHFNLTEGFGKAAMPRLHTVIVRSLLLGMNQQQIRQTLEQQLDAFEAGFGQSPDFIDGHQHVHQLPGIRQAVLQVIKRRYPEHPIWVRNTMPADPAWRGKAQILKLLGGKVTAENLEYADVHSNRGFAGVYGFDRADYDVCFQSWLEAARPGMLIMCHPATAPGPDDAIAQQRVVEYQFFNSAQYTEMLSAARVRLVRLSSLVEQE